MKNFKLIAPIALAMMIAVYSIGCGSGAAGGGGSSGSSGKSGKLSDPYISGAVVGVISTDGTLMTTMTDETDDNGYFEFPSAVPLGCTIEMRTMGEHLGLSYEVVLRKFVDGAGDLNLTPFTAVNARGLSQEAIIYLLKEYAGITVDASAFTSDPMSGLSNINDTNFNSNKAAIEKIRGAICVYSITRILNAAYDANTNFDPTSVEAYKAQLASMGTAVRSGLSDDIIEIINATIDAKSKVTLPDVPAPGDISTAEFSLPHVTFDDIAKSAFIITRTIVDDRINASLPYTTASTVEGLTQEYGQSIGMRIYLNRIYNDPISGTIHSYITSGFMGAPYGYIYNSTTSEVLIKNRVIGNIQDAFGNTLTTSDVDGLMKGYSINSATTVITPNP